MILSHHGKLEFGSPKVPQFPEALLLHYLDDMDSKMECMRALIESDRQVEGCFTAYNAPLERTVLKKELFLNPAGGAAASAAPRPPPARAVGARSNGASPKSGIALRRQAASRPCSRSTRPRKADAENRAGSASAARAVVPERPVVAGRGRRESRAADCGASRVRWLIPPS